MHPVRSRADATIRPVGQAHFPFEHPLCPISNAAPSQQSVPKLDKFLNTHIVEQLINALWLRAPLDRDPVYARHDDLYVPTLNDLQSVIEADFLFSWPFLIRRKRWLWSIELGPCGQRRQASTCFWIDSLQIVKSSCCRMKTVLNFGYTIPKSTLIQLQRSKQAR